MTARDRFAVIVNAELVELLDAYVASASRPPSPSSRRPPPNGAPEWLTLEQAGERLGCSADAVRMRVKRGRLEARHQGRRVYVSRASVDGLR